MNRFAIDYYTMLTFFLVLAAIASTGAAQEASVTEKGLTVGIAKIGQGVYRVNVKSQDAVGYLAVGINSGTAMHGTKFLAACSACHNTYYQYSISNRDIGQGKPIQSGVYDYTLKDANKEFEFTGTEIYGSNIEDAGYIQVASGFVSSQLKLSRHTKTIAIPVSRFSAFSTAVPPDQGTDQGGSGEGSDQTPDAISWALEKQLLGGAIDFKYRKLDGGLFEILAETKGGSLPDYFVFGVNSEAKMHDTKAVILCAYCANNVAQYTPIGLSLGNPQTTNLDVSNAEIKRLSNGHIQARFTLSELNGLKLGAAKYIMVGHGTQGGASNEEPKKHTQMAIYPQTDFEFGVPGQVDQGNNGQDPGTEADLPAGTITLFEGKGSLTWKVLGGSSVEMTLAHTAKTGWLSVGMSPDNTMVGARAIIGVDSTVNPTLKGVDCYKISEKNLAGVKPYDQECMLENASFEVLPTGLQLKFKTSHIADIALALNASSQMLFVYGQDTKFQIHDTPQQLAVSWPDSQAIAPEPQNTGAIVAHGALMLLAFGFLFPIGILMSVFRDKFDGDGWFLVHKVIQTCGLLVVVLSLILIIIRKNKDGRKHFETTHEKIGISVIVMVILQILFAVLLRGKKGDVGNVSARTIWFFQHFLFAVLLLALGMYACYLGAHGARYGMTSASIQHVTQGSYKAFLAFIYLGIGMGFFAMASSLVLKLTVENEKQSRKVNKSHSISSGAPGTRAYYEDMYSDSETDDRV